MIPRTFGETARRECPASPASVRSLPASIGRGSRVCTRTSWVWCRALRLALALAHAFALALALALGTRTWHSHLALALGTRHSRSALALGTRARHSHSARGTRTRTRTRTPHAALALALALGTRHSALNLGRRTVGPMESCRHQLVSSKRPKTPQPSSRGPVRAEQFRRADDSAHIRSTCRLAAQRGRGGCAEHPDSLSRTLRAAHPNFGVASSASGGRRPLPVPAPSIPGLDFSVGSQCSPRGRTDSGDRRRRRRRELEPAWTPTRGGRTSVASTRAAADDPHDFPQPPMSSHALSVAHQVPRAA